MTTLISLTLVALAMLSLTVSSPLTCVMLTTAACVVYAMGCAMESDEDEDEE